MKLSTILFSVLILGICASAQAEVRQPVRYHQLFPSPVLGQYTIARVRGPGVFVAASVVGIGLDLAQVAAYVQIDGQIVLATGLGSGDASIGGQTNSGIGVMYSPEFGGRARASFGLAEPLRFNRELVVYVRVEDGAPERVFGDVVVGAAN